PRDIRFGRWTIHERDSAPAGKILLCPGDIRHPEEPPCDVPQLGVLVQPAKQLPHIRLDVRLLKLTRRVDLVTTNLVAWVAPMDPHLGQPQGPRGQFWNAIQPSTRLVDLLNLALRVAIRKVFPVEVVDVNPPDIEGWLRVEACAIRIAHLLGPLAPALE